MLNVVHGLILLAAALAVVGQTVLADHPWNTGDAEASPVLHMNAVLAPAKPRLRHASPSVVTASRTPAVDRSLTARQ